jgi:hypothetical protein
MAIGLQPMAMTASQPCSSNHRASVTVVAEAMTFAPAGRHPVQQRPLCQTEMKADHGVANLLDQRAKVSSKRVRPQAGGVSAGRESFYFRSC